MGEKRSKSVRGDQLTIALHRHGGARAGAGRPRSKTSGMPHVARPTLSGREPLLVTLKLVEGLASLRSARMFRRVLANLVRAKERLGTRIVHFSVQSDHVHLLVEAASKSALSRAMKGLAVRLARAVNHVLGRTGAVLRDRYHARVLETPRQTRNAIAYVLCNAHKHGHAPNVRGWVDECSSAGWFDGWVTSRPERMPAPLATAPPRTWLLRVGWRRGGFLHPDHRPGAMPT
jgi:REP element-mobilizing transposase RayT